MENVGHAQLLAPLATPLYLATLAQNTQTSLLLSVDAKIRIQASTLLQGLWSAEGGTG
jgi:hypothetical protein